jgi:acyl-CoA synthetase (AMP-forming)/AMP-acid ligase II
MKSLAIKLSPHQERIRTLSMPAALDLTAQTFGNQVAIRHIEGDGPTLTWKELRTQVSQLRSGFARAGIRPGDRVGIQLGNQVEFPLTWLAVVALGAAVVPLNPKYTVRESIFVLQDASARWLVGAADVLAGYGSTGEIADIPPSNVITVGREASPAGGWSFDDLASGPETELSVCPLPEDIANIQFTSGTTGLPKGCLLTHRYWIELGVWISAAFDSQRMLADHPFYYMQNQAYLMAAMASGGAVYVTGGLSRRKFFGWLVDHQIDFAWIEEEMVNYSPIPDPSSLHLKRAPVDGCSPEGIARLEATFNLLARDFYGSTEVGVGTMVPWDRPDLAAKGSMGFCFPTRESMIIDSDAHEVASGETGELCIRGEGMMLGYHNRPEENAALFLRGGWFRTGDLVKKDDEGAHFFQGRLKDMVRRSGENIATAEVEQQIASMAQVSEVAVIAVPDADRGEEVKAIVVVQPDALVTAEQVAEHARSGLAAFKVPRYIEFRESLPRTSSGKVHKAALRSEDPDNHATTDLKPSGAQ